MSKAETKETKDGPQLTAKSNKTIRQNYYSQRPLSAYAS